MGSKLMLSRRLLVGLGFLVAFTVLLLTHQPAEAEAPEVVLTSVGTNASGDLTLRMTLVGDHAYVADMANGLVILDVSDPTDPQYVGGYKTSSNVNDVAVVGNYAYVAGYEKGLFILDISDPTDPQYLGVYESSGWAYSVVVEGDHAYVADYGAGLTIIDVSDPTDPQLAGSYDTDGDALSVVLAGDYAYIGDHKEGVLLLDVSDPTNPQYAEEINTIGWVYDVTLVGDLLYASNHDYGFVVIDVSNKSHLIDVGSYDTKGYTKDVVVDGDLAYVADGDHGVAVFDISDVANIKKVGGIDTSDYVRSVTLVGDHLYVCDTGNGLAIMEINYRPTPTIDSITPSPVNEGEEVTFIGSGTDTDGSVAAYGWRSDLGGELSTSATFSTKDLNGGDHTIYLKVQDDEGAWSSEASLTLQVVNRLPNASIDSIKPSPAYADGAVTFTGSGTDSAGDIVGYDWRSDLDDLLSTNATFSHDNLSVGEHNISLRVQDSEGAWSEPVTVKLEVKPGRSPEDDDDGFLALPFTLTLAAGGIALVARRYRR